MIVLKRNPENKDILTRLTKIESNLKKIKSKKYLKKIYYYENKVEISKKITSLKENNEKLNLEINKLKKENKIILDKFNELKMEEKIVKNENKINKKLMQVELENKLIMEKSKNEIKVYNKILNEELKITKKIHEFDVKFLNENIKSQNQIKDLKEKIIKIEKHLFSKSDNKINIDSSLIGDNIDKKLKEKKNLQFIENNKKEIEKIFTGFINKIISKYKDEIPKSFLNNYEIKNFKFRILKNMINNCEMDSKEIISYMNKNKNIFNLIDNQKHSLLYYAIINGRKKIIELLNKLNKAKFHKHEFFNEKEKKKNYEKLIDIYLNTENFKEKALKFAFEKNMPKLIKILLLRNKKIDLSVICKETYQICELVDNENTEIIKLIITEMLKRGKSLNNKDSTGRKLIHYSVYKNNNLEIVKYIVELGANINEGDKSDWKPIHFAARYTKNLEIFQYLFDLKNNINDITKSGTRPIHCACCNENSDILKFIISVNDNINYMDQDCWKPIHFACDFDILENIKILLILGADINEKVLYKRRRVSGLFFLNVKNQRILNNLKLI